MNSDNKYFNPDRIVAIFLLLVLASGALFLHFFSNLALSGWQNIVNKTLLYFGIFGYLVIIGIVLFYYISKANKWLKKDTKRVVLVLAIFLGLGYSIFDGLSENSWLIFVRDLFMVSLIIIGLPFIEKLLSKIPSFRNKEN